MNTQRPGKGKEDRIWRIVEALVAAGPVGIVTIVALVVILLLGACAIPAGSAALAEAQAEEQRRLCESSLSSLPLDRLCLRWGYPRWVRSLPLPRGPSSEPPVETRILPPVDGLPGVY